MSVARILLLTFLLSPGGANAGPWLDVPLVRQRGEGCGPAAIAMVIQYWAGQDPRLAATAAATERINQDLPATGRGVAGSALKSYLEAHGFDAFVFRGDRAELENEVRKGRPVVICFAPRRNRGLLHFAVVVGVDGKALWLNDPQRGKLIREPLLHFQAAWDATENWSLVAVPRPLL